MTLYQIIEKLQAVKTVLPNLISDSIEETKDDYIAGIKKQLLAGFDASGNNLVPSYRNPKYAVEKNVLNPAPGLGNPDLFLTGAWFAGMDMIVEGDNAHTGSSDSKDLQLQMKYGADIEKLGTTFLDDYRIDSLGPVVKRNLTDLTNLKFT